MPRISHRTYSLTFPSDFGSTQFIRLLRSLSGLSRGWPGLSGVPPALVFETWSEARGLTFRLRVPAPRAQFVLDQLRVHVPGIRAEPEPGPTTVSWTKVVELGVRRLDRTLHVPEPEALTASLLAALQPGRQQTLLLQWVVAPASAARAPEQRPTRSRRGRHLVLVGSATASDKDDIADRRKKLADGRTWLGVLRVAVRADTPEHAGALLASVRTALRSTATPANGFYRRFATQRVLRRRVAAGSAPLLFPSKLSASELAALTAWPTGRPVVAGLPPAQPRQLPPTDVIPRSDAPILMRADYPGMERPLCITPADLGLHAVLVGRSGTGKTTLAVDLAAQLAEHGHGLVAVETKATTDETFFIEFLRRVPKHRKNDVIIIDVGDKEYATAYSLLDDGNPQIAVEGICALFDHLYGSTQSIYAREALYMGLTTLAAQPGYTFVDLPVLFSPRNATEAAWRDEVVQSVQDPELRDFWRRHLQERPKPEQARFVQPLLDRVWILNARPEIRRIFGQSKSSFSARRVLEENKIILFNLSGVGEATAELAGVLLVNQLWAAIRSVRPKKRNFLILDEWASLLNLPVKLDDLLAQMRSFKTGALLATQNLSLVPPQLRSAVLANTATKMIFTVGGDDARLFAREFGAGLTDEDFLYLERYQAIARIAAEGRSSSPVTGVTLPPSQPTGMAGYVRWYSRKHYGKPIAAVDAEIRNRYRPKHQPPTATRPTIGSQTWE